MYDIVFTLMAPLHSLHITDTAPQPVLELQYEIAGEAGGERGGGGL
jgi:hypothetical protein